MRVTYKPEDGNEPQSWDFNPGRVRVSEQVIVEKQFGGTWLEFKTGVMSGSAQARRVLLWHLIRREHPAHNIRDTPDFFDDELLIEQTLAEVTESYNEWLKGGGRDSANGELLEGMFQAEIKAATEREGGDEPAGKAPSKSEPDLTSGPSPKPSESAPGTSESG